MSISTDMSGSDELSLDGSDSNSIIEAARESAQQQHAETEVSKPSEVVAQDDSIEPPVSEGTSEGAKSAIGNRATLQLNPSEACDVDAVDAVDDVDDVDDAKADTGVVGAKLEAPQTDGSDVLVETDESGEGQESSDDTPSATSTASNVAPSNKVGLLSSEVNSTKRAAEQDSSASENGSGTSGDRIAYVAFDDGIPDEEDMPDMSMQSLDVGVESLSMDDSLHLGRLQPEQREHDLVNSEDVRDTVEGVVSDSDKSVRLRVYTDQNPVGTVFDVPETGIVLGRKADASPVLSDTCISPKHCQLTFVDGALQLVDLDSVNGTWMRIPDAHELAADCQIRLGRQSFTVQRRPLNTTDQSTAEGETTRWESGEHASEWCLTTSAHLCVPIPESGLRLGRLSGTLLFEYDASLSSVHAVMVPGGDCLHFKDFNSRTGSWLKLDGAVELVAGSEFLLGDTRFRLESA